MLYVFVLIGIWVVISFIYSKIKKETFLSSLVLVPLAILGFLFNDMKKNSSYSKVEAEAKKQGRDDVLAKINQTKASAGMAESYVRRAESKVKNKEED